MNPKEENSNFLTYLIWIMSVPVIAFVLFLLNIFFDPFVSSVANLSYDLYHGVTNITKSKNSDPILENIRVNILPSIVQITCPISDKSTDTQSGSGLYFVDPVTNKPMIQTNAHVLLGAKDMHYRACFIYFPKEDGSTYDSAYITGSAEIFHKSISTVNGVKMEGLDIAQAEILPIPPEYSKTTYPFPPIKKDVYKESEILCKQNSHEIKIGDKIYAIGYPFTGGNSITLTEGRISGFSDDERHSLKISASSNHGSSGGLIIGQDDGCIYGILNSGTDTTGGSLGYAIPVTLIKNFINNEVAEKMYTLPSLASSSKEYLTENFKSSDLSLKYPSSWVHSTKNNQDLEKKNIVHYFVPPNESFLDNFAGRLGFMTLEAEQIGELKDSKSSNVAEDISQFISEANKNGFEDISTSTIVTASGVKIFQSSFWDSKGLQYDAPVHLVRSILYYNNRRYVINQVYFDNENKSIYEKIFSQIIISITIRP